MSLGFYATQGVQISPSGAVIFLAAIAATLTIGVREPRVEYGYELVLFTLACLVSTDSGMKLMPGLVLAAMLSWGFIQLALGGSVYRFATLQGSLRGAALAATAWVSYRSFSSRERRTDFLRMLAWFGAFIALTSVLAYFTSPGKILWILDAPYPDVWGPFLSRNNFAQFLELAMPAALWLGLREAEGGLLYVLFAAMMLASGLTAASRAGAAILVLEVVAVLSIRRRSPTVPRMALGLVFGTILFAAIPGIGHLAGRMREPDPYQGRREITRSTVAMIASRPWTGFGLGTFATVYPAYALFDTGNKVEHAHNDWLEWAAEGGIPYAAMWMALAVWAVRPAVRSVWGIGVLGCFLHGVVDYPFARFGISAWTFVLIGMLARTDLREVRRPSH